MFIYVEHAYLKKYLPALPAIWSRMSTEKRPLGVWHSRLLGMPMCVRMLLTCPASPTLVRAKMDR
eukprot:729010-Prorocentrum_minimum.AAC.1